MRGRKKKGFVGILQDKVIGVRIDNKLYDNIVLVGRHVGKSVSEVCRDILIKAIYLAPERE